MATQGAVRKVLGVANSAVSKRDRPARAVAVEDLVRGFKTGESELPSRRFVLLFGRM